MEVGDRLNPERSYRKGFALKGLHQHIIKTNNPSTIGTGELLTVRFPDLKENQVSIPGTTKLTFNITLAGTDVNRTLVENLGRNIIRKLIVKLEGNEIISIDDYDILYSSCHLWHGPGGVILKNRKISINYWFLRPCSHNLVKMQILGNFK